MLYQHSTLYKRMTNRNVNTELYILGEKETLLNENNVYKIRQMEENQMKCYLIRTNKIPVPL